jgi:HEAT repeat protein
MLPLLLVLLPLPAAPQLPPLKLQEPKQVPSNPIVEDDRAIIRRARASVAQGSAAIPDLTALLANANGPVRAAAVESMVAIGGPQSLDPLVKAAATDTDVEVQARAVDGIVNFYLPGYAKSGGLSGKLKRIGTSIQAKWIDVNDQVIPDYIEARPDAVAALARVARDGGTLEVQANAARGLGVMRGRAGLPALYDLIKGKQDLLLYESLVAIKKIGDPAAAPRIEFLIKDLNERVAVAALEAIGVLQYAKANGDIRALLERDRTLRVKQSAFLALAMMPEPANRPVYERYLTDKEDRIRSAAIEGLGRLRDPADVPKFEAMFPQERGMRSRLALAFALVMAGKTEIAEFSPFKYLINTLTSAAWKGYAQPFLIEAARQPVVRQTLHTLLTPAMAAQWTRDERIGLAQVLGVSGNQDSVRVLEGLVRDADAGVGEEAVRALRTLRARL